jgi:hypothetical protein
VSLLRFLGVKGTLVVGGIAGLAQFQRGSLPKCGAVPTTYQDPRLVVFAGAVSTGGCGSAMSASGPFYCPADRELYIEPSFRTTPCSDLGRESRCGLRRRDLAHRRQLPGNLARVQMFDFLAKDWEGPLLQLVEVTAART